MPGETRTVHGIHPVLEALRAHPGDVERVYVLDGSVAPRAAAEILSRAREARVKVERLSRERLAAMVEGGVHQGVAARLREFAYASLEEVLARAAASGRPPLVVVLDGLQDPHNLGAVIRSADALGVHGVVLPRDRSVGVTATVARASAGAVEHVPVARVTNLSRALEVLKTSGLWVAAADPEGDQALWDARLEGPLAVVVGAEGGGVRPGVLKHCDLRLRIPMAGQVGSLNASVSAALVLYEVARQRSGAGASALTPAKSVP
ncbi:MAG TPA: 23S rRNA (guanosine(2251)-2'-O)-methyltransferase RlmB [Myxococcaceae bacterium]|nr:23S rRNA (guanosine(2251)-2'-O)-methyltransferase RlmB [Myxococcaceae bacterium]